MSDKLAQRLAYEDYEPKLSDLNQYFNDQGFVGDENTRMALSIGVIVRKCLGVVSVAGGGKSEVVNTLIDMFYPGQVYKMGAGSDKAPAYEGEKINNSNIIYLTEIQKAGTGDVAVEMLKDLGEGKDYSRKVVRNGKDIENQVIKAGKTVLYTKALENKYETGDELDRRFPKLPTDITKSQNSKVVKSKASSRARPFRGHVLKQEDEDGLVYHMNECVSKDAGKFLFINPLADYLSDQIPTTFVISRTYTDHYFDFIEGVTWFNQKQRLRTEINEKDCLFVTPEDCWQLHQIYGHQFLQDVLNIPPNGLHVIDAFKAAEQSGVKSSAKKNAWITMNEEEGDETKLTVKQIFELLMDMGIVLKEQVILKILNTLGDVGYVYSDTTNHNGKPVTEYYLSNEIKDFENNIDWKGAIEFATSFMEEHYPEQAHEYISNLPSAFIDPFTGDEVVITTTQEETITNDEDTDERDEWTGSLAAE